MPKPTINLANTTPRTPVDFFMRVRRKKLAKALAVYLHSHDTEEWPSPAGRKLIKVDRCPDCEAGGRGHEEVA